MKHKIYHNNDRKEQVCGINLPKTICDLIMEYDYYFSNEIDTVHKIDINSEVIGQLRNGYISILSSSHTASTITILNHKTGDCYLTINIPNYKYIFLLENNNIVISYSDRLAIYETGTCIADLKFPPDICYKPLCAMNDMIICPVLGHESYKECQFNLIGWNTDVIEIYPKHKFLINTAKSILSLPNGTLLGAGLNSYILEIYLFDLKLGFTAPKLIFEFPCYNDMFIENFAFISINETKIIILYGSDLAIIDLHAKTLTKLISIPHNIVSDSCHIINNEFVSLVYSQNKYNFIRVDIETRTYEVLEFKFNLGSLAKIIGYLPDSKVILIEKVCFDKVGRLSIVDLDNLMSPISTASSNIPNSCILHDYRIIVEIDRGQLAIYH